MTDKQRKVLQDATVMMTEPIIEELIRDICKSILKAGAITDSAEYRIYRAQALGAAKKKIIQEVARQTEINEEVIDSLFEYIKDVSGPVTQNGSMDQIIQGYADLCKKKSSEKLNDLWAPLPDGTAVPVEKAYAHYMDYAFRNVSTGAMDYNTAMRRATAQLAKRGIRTRQVGPEDKRRTIGIEYSSRLYLMDQMGQLDDVIQQKNHDDLGCDGWEISAHAACAPDHEDIQGRQFSDEEFEALNASLQRPIGHLNCGHWATPIILGVNSPQYTEEELKAFRDSNERGLTYEGRHYTLYQASQTQSSIENQITTIKRQILVDEETGSDKLRADRIHLKTLESRYRDFCEKTGLPTRTERLQTAGFGRSQASRAVWEYKRKDENILTNAAGQKIIKVTKTEISGGPKNGITQVTSKKGGITRNYYDENGRQIKQISNNGHGNKKEEKFGRHGEHTHDYIYDSSGKLIDRPSRELTEIERKENADFL